MQKTKASESSYIIDCAGLTKVSQTKNNALRSTALELLENGKMQVPTGVADELKEAFDDEYDDLKPHIKTRVRMKPAHTITIASLASKANSSFKIEPYGSSDWIAAAVATCEDCILVTTAERKPFYVALLKCTVITVEELI